MSWTIRNNRKINMVVVGLLLICLLGALLNATAYASGQHDVELVVQQEFVIINGIPPSDVFAYKLEAKTSDAPMPAGSTTNGFNFTIVGNDIKEIGTITFTKPGIFIYQMSCTTENLVNYTVDYKVYIIEVHISTNWDVITVAYNEKTGFKVGELSFAHRYNEPITPTPPPPTPTPPTVTPPTPTPPPTITPPTITPPTTKPPVTVTPTDPPYTPETTIPEEEATIDPPDFPGENIIDEADIPQDDTDDNANLTLVEDKQPPTVSTQGTRRASWALLNLILSILGALAAIATTIYIILKQKRKEDKDDETLNNAENKKLAIETNQIDELNQNKENEEDEECKKRVRKISFIAMYILAILAIILFILTQDMRLPMIYIDKWTIIHIILAIIEVIAIITVRKKRKNRDEDDDETDHEDDLENISRI
ncbi:MAG: hypothetical protein FWD05_09805 [Oscillospiraceae bacterium]|nr:hypothetical protein [Oscillospiraceae bacterium]